MKVVIEPRVKRYAKMFGIEFRQSEVPSQAGIMGVDHLAEKVPAMYFNGTGVIWICKTLNGRRWTHDDVQFIALHEVGHAMVGFFPKLAISRRDHEIKANAIALALCVILGIRVRPLMLKRLTKFSKQKKLV